MKNNPTKLSIPYKYTLPDWRLIQSLAILFPSDILVYKYGVVLYKCLRGRLTIHNERMFKNRCTWFSWLGCAVILRLEPGCKGFTWKHSLNLKSTSCGAVLYSISHTKHPLIILNWGFGHRNTACLVIMLKRVPFN